MLALYGDGKGSKRGHSQVSLYELFISRSLVGNTKGLYNTIILHFGMDETIIAFTQLVNDHIVDVPGYRYIKIL